VFKIDGSGQFTVLYSFTSTNGCTPNAGLVFDPGGAYFGTFNYYQDDPGIEQWTGGGIFKLTKDSVAGTVTAPTPKSHPPTPNRINYLPSQPLIHIPDSPPPAASV